MEGRPDYVAMMKQFSEISSHKSEIPPSVITQNNLFDYLRRRLNKLLGRPSTREVGIMAAMISTIKDGVEAQTKTVTKHAVIAVPNLFGSDNLQRAQFQEDLEEASNLAGLKPLLTPFWLGAPAAAAASQQWGMCAHYDDLYACEAEEEQMPIETVLAIEYTTRAMIVTMFPLQAASSNSDELTRISMDLGSNNEENEGHWDGVRNMIQELPTMRDETPLTKVIVMGESANSKDFLDAVRKALGPQVAADLMPSLNLHEFDPLYAVARGAAEFAKRKQEAPKGCVESEECKKIRNELKRKYIISSDIDQKPLQDL